MTDTLQFWVGNLSPEITQVITINGTPVDLSAETVRFRMRPVGSDTLKVDQTAAFVTDGTDGALKYAWQTADVDTAGLYLVWWTVTDGGNTQDVSESVVEFRAHGPAGQPGYVELEVVKHSLELVGQTYADVDLQNTILASSRILDEACGRRFYLDLDNTSVRYYTPDSQRIIEIDDIVDLQELALDRTGLGAYDEVWTENTQFVLNPVNADQDFRPWETVMVRRQNGGLGNYGFGRYWLPCVDRGVRVTGQFGWPSVPADIATATSILATKLFRRAREAPFGVVMPMMDAAAAVRISKYDPDIGPIVAKYTRHRPFI